MKLSGILDIRGIRSHSKMMVTFNAGKTDFPTRNEVLNMIASASLGGSGEGVNLSAYLQKTEAESLYQPIGNYLTQHQSLEGYATQTWVAQQGFLNQHQSLAAYLKSSDAANLYQPKGNYLTQQDISNLATKEELFSGSYNDLDDKPTIPSVDGLISEATADGKYQPKGTYLTEHQSLDYCVKKTDAITIKGVKEDGTEITFTIYGSQV